AITALNRKSKIRNPKSEICKLRSAIPFALILAAILATWWLCSHRIDRFLLPAWPFAALLAAIGAASLDGLWPRRVVLAIAGLGLAWCFLADCSTLVGDNRWFVALEQLRRDHPWPDGTRLRVKLEHQWLNENIQPGRAVLLVGDAAGFDLEMPVYYNTCFDNCLLCDWMLDQSPRQKSPGQWRDELASRRIAWVLVDWPEIARYQSPGNYGFDPRFSPELIEELVRHRVIGPPETIRSQTEGRPPERYPVRGVAAKQPAGPGVP
ncbi:MAG TPA: hypothetical protein VFV87_15200, partial [Pirellulaceae bacterium]|nr:hypothetical protein [Pirellulaceae bacterium]